MKIKIISFFLITAAIHSSLAAEQLASIYEFGKTEGPPLFTQKMNYEIDSSGLRNAEVIVTDPEGKTVLHETSVTKNGALISLKVEQRQTQKIFEIIQNGKIVTFKRTGEKDRTEEVPDNFLGAPGLEYFIHSQWKPILNGETVHIRLGLAERGDTVGLKIFKKDLIQNGDNETVVIRIKPSSIIIAALTDPVDLYIDTKKMKLLRFKGQSFLRKNVNGKLKPLDVEIIYN